MGNKLKNLTKNKLKNLYWNKKLSLYKIAKIFNVHVMAIFYWMKKYKIPRRSISEAGKGKKAWNKELKGFRTKGSFKKGSIPKNPIKKGEHRSKKTEFTSERVRTMWEEEKFKKNKETLQRLNKNPEFQKKRLKALVKKPNKPETLLIDIIKRNKLPFKYVGNGDFLIGNKNPDFVHNNEKLIIEVFGDYWHNLPNMKKRDIKKISIYSKFGYKTLIIWESEINGRNNKRLTEKEIIKKIKDSFPLIG